MTRKLRIGERIRALLLGRSTGMTVREISKQLLEPQDLIETAMRRNFGFYISAWSKNEQRFKGSIAVWSCVQVPDSVPMPKGEIDFGAQSISIEQRNKKLKAMRETQKAINARLKAQRDAERLASKNLKAKIKAEVQAMKDAEKAEVEARKLARQKSLMQPAAPKGYKPEKTAWVTPPPWSH